LNSTIHAWIQWCFVGFEQFPKETRFKSLIENICIGLGSTAKVIYISTNTSDQMSVNATVFTPLREKPLILVTFFPLSKRNQQKNYPKLISWNLERATIFAVSLQKCLELDELPKWVT